MTMYNPIMKAKTAEFEAWRMAAPAVVAKTRPVFEVVPDKGPARDLQLVFNGLTNGWPSPAAVATIDSGYLDQTVPVLPGGTDGPIGWLAQELQYALPYRPVVRLDDDPTVLNEAGVAARLHGAGVCLRIGDPDNDPDLGAATAVLPSLLAAMGLAVSEVHLLVDLWVVESDRDVTRALPLAEAAVKWADANGPWASVTVASGAFPASISNLPRNTSTPLGRYDAKLWRQLIVLPALPLQPDFGDFTMVHPAVATGGRAPLPNLRYTNERKWDVWREEKALPGNESFFTLCERVTAGAGYSGPAYSWGDSEISRCSTSTGGAGQATKWRAFGTSHHLAAVIDGLTTRGEP